MLGSLARRRCSLPDVVNFIQSHRVHAWELLRKLNQDRNTLQWLCILLHVFIHLILWCHDTLQFHLAAIPTKPFHLFRGRGHIDLRKRIFALDGAFALTCTWFRLYTSWCKWSPIRWHHNGFRPQYRSFLCTSARTSHFPDIIEIWDRNSMPETEKTTSKYITVVGIYSLLGITLRDSISMTANQRWI